MYSDFHLVIILLVYTFYTFFVCISPLKICKTRNITILKKCLIVFHEIFDIYTKTTHLKVCMHAHAHTHKYINISYIIYILYHISYIYIHIYIHTYIYIYIYNHIYIYIFYSDRQNRIDKTTINLLLQVFKFHAFAIIW